MKKLVIAVLILMLTLGCIGIPGSQQPEVPQENKVQEAVPQPSISTYNMLLHHLNYLSNNVQTLVNDLNNYFSIAYFYIVQQNNSTALQNYQSDYEYAISNDIGKTLESINMLKTDLENAKDVPVEKLDLVTKAVGQIEDDTNDLRKDMMIDLKEMVVKQALLYRAINILQGDLEAISNAIKELAPLMKKTSEESIVE